MNPNELLEQLTGPRGGDVEALVRAARAGAARRRMLRNTASTALALALIAAGLGLLLRPEPELPTAITTQPQPPPVLTGEELLDSFGEQPVALVTYPDGSQRLLSIVRP